MKKTAIAAAAVVAIAVLGLAAVPLAERYSAGQIKAGIEADGTATASSVEVGLFSRRIKVEGLHVRQGVEVGVGRWEASGLSWPLGELLRGRTPLAGLKPGDPLHANHLELDDVRVTDGTASLSVASLAVDGLELERYDASANRPDAVPALVARIVGALSVRRLEQKRTTFVAPGAADSFALADLTIENLDHGRVGSLVLSGLSTTPSGAVSPSFSLAELRLAGLDLSRQVKALSGPSRRLDRPLGRIGIDKASATGFGGEGLKRYGIALGSITSETTHQGPGVSRTETKIDGFVLSAPAGGLQALQTRIVLQAMGLKEIRLGLDCLGREDRPKAEIVVDRCTLAGPDLANVVLSGKVVQADAAFWKAVDDGDIAALMGSKAALGEAKLVLADKGLLERTLKALAATSGRSPSEMRALVAREVRQFQPAGVLITDELTKLLDTVARFVETGGTLTLDSRPDPPVGFARASYFRIPGPDWVNLLGLTATLSR